MLWLRGLALAASDLANASNGTEVVCVPRELCNLVVYEREERDEALHDVVANLHLGGVVGELLVTVGLQLFDHLVHLRCVFAQVA